MNKTSEIETLKKVAAALTPLEPDARRRVIDYVCNLLSILPNSISTPQRLEHSKDPRAKIELSQDDKPKSAQQYLREYKYHIMTKRIAVMGVYLDRERKISRFSFKDLTHAFRDAKESKMPAHSQYVRAVVMGYLAKEGDQYYATSKADALVDDYKKSQTSQAHEEDQ